jgi:hypothetical protein
VSAAGVLLELRARGIEVDATNAKIRCRHAPGALAAELAERVRERREEILVLLVDPDVLRVAVAQEVFDAEEDVIRCRACGTERTAETASCPTCHPRARRGGAS